MTTAKNILDVARKYMGSVEGGSNHAHILSVYNNTKPLPVGYKVSATDSWCATFVSFCAIEAGVPNFYGRECSVPRYVTIFESLGIWLEDGTVTPKVGDIIVYNWDDNTQPNNGYADHIGFVEAVSGGTITTIEGNKNDSVSRRTLSVGAGNIRGYARPKYSGTTPTTPTTTVYPAPSKPKPSKPATVTGPIADVQRWLNATYNTGLKVDNLAGPATKRAIAIGIQTEINRQFGGHIAVDGIFRQASKAAFKTVRQGARGNMTRLIQAALICKGYNVNGFDGIFAGGLANAVRRFQSATGRSADAIVGPDTAYGLFA